MIELPEAALIALQISESLRGIPILSASTGSEKHKWVFYSPSKELIEKRFRGNAIRDAVHRGRGIHIQLENDFVFYIDDFGGKILLVRSGDMVPKKYHLKIDFPGDMALYISIQGWGFMGVLKPGEIDDTLRVRLDTPSADDPVVTEDWFVGMMNQYHARDTDSIKTYFTNAKTISGIGNGYLQDILFMARIHPRKKIHAIHFNEQRMLFTALKRIIGNAVSLHGRWSEFDLHGKRGGYRPLMDRYTKGKPCTNCGSTIEKIHYLGGSCYICSKCQRI